MAASPIASTNPPATPKGAAEVFIELRDLHKRFGKQEILCGIDLKLYHGETLCIIGPSGEGKTVTMKHIIGLIRPDSGEITVLGEHGSNPSVREKIGVVLEDGTRVLLTLDPRVQAAAQNTLERYKVEWGAVIALRPQTGEVLAFATE